MKRTYMWALILSSIVSSIYAKDVIKTEICIYGGTSAGVIAAYTAKQLGKEVLLIEPGKHLGGMSVSGLGFTDIGNKYVVKGVARDFYRQLGSHYGKLEQWIFEPSVAENIFNRYIQKANVKVILGYRLQSVRKLGNLIQTIEIEEADNIRSVQTIQAKVFIDCSYEGDLMAQSGVSYTVGRESNDLYNETYNGVQLMDGHQFPDGVDPYVEKGNPASGLLWGISDTSMLPNGSGDPKVQAYNYRICLTDNPDNRIPITKPDGYDASTYELLIRLKEQQPWKTLHDLFIWQIMPNRKTDINNFGGFSTDMIGMNWCYPEASYQERTQIIREHEEYTKGLLYFLGHDQRVPDTIRKEMLRWGYPADEYRDNNHWSPQLYIRESRRMIGELVMTQHHCQGSEVVKDPIGWAAYTMDSHNCDRHVINGMVKNEGNVEVGGFAPYPISYRAIVPRKDQVGNLIVPVCMSASHIAYGSIRMEPVFMVLAQSAAVAGCLSIDNGVMVQEINTSQLQALIEENPLGDGRTPEILIDNDDSSQVQMIGDWQPNYDTYRGYGSNFLTDSSKAATFKAVKYIPHIRTEGEYAVYIYCPKLEQISTQTHITIFDGKQSLEKQIKACDIQTQGQALGEWVSIGKYRLQKGTDAFIQISNINSDNIITADAVLFLPIN